MSDTAPNEQMIRFVPLGEVSEITMGQSPESLSLNTSEEGLPFLQGCAEFGRKSPLTTVYCNPPLRVSKPESVLISVRAPVGTLNWGDQSYCIGRGLASIRADGNVAETDFLFYAIAQAKDQHFSQLAETISRFFQFQFWISNNKKKSPIFCKPSTRPSKKPKP